LKTGRTQPAGEFKMHDYLSRQFAVIRWVKKWIPGPSAICILLTVCLAFSGLARGAGLRQNPLYESKVPAADQAALEQPILIQQAFKNVLTQVTGSETILNHPSVVKAIPMFDRYLTQFGYQQTNAQDRILRVQFDEIAVNELIQNAGQSVFNQKRDPVLLWLAVQQDVPIEQSIPDPAIQTEASNTALEWIGADSQHDWVQKLTVLAKTRGIPLVFPLLDLEDTTVVSEHSIWAEDLNALQTAAERYHAETLLVGRICQQPSGWSARWTLVRQGVPSHHWEGAGLDISRLLSQAMETLVARLATLEARGTTIATETRQADLSGRTLYELRLGVSGVRDVQQYAKVARYLKTLPTVSEVEVAEITPQRMVFNIKVTAERERIIKSIAIGRLLVEDFSANTEFNQEINYKMAETL